ncbi:MAG: alpha/beta hydrolase [Burkholderiales bacterium]|nr:alpha/beta hydrolase [Burkholderiales bacterium]
MTDENVKPSLRARCLNAAFRRFVKERAIESFDLDGARRLVASLDRWLGMGGHARRTEVDAGGVPADWITGRAPAGPRTLLYLHGGGFMMRSPRLHAGLAARLCDLLGARALMPWYRLAPEHPLPAAHEDCIHAYRWLLAQGCPAEDIVVAGDSAGGLLTLATLQRARDAGLQAPACGVLFSPGCDLSAVDEAAAAAGDDPLLSADLLRLLARIVVTPIDPRDPAISPAAGSLGGLPPLLVQVGSTEALLGQSRKAVELTRAAGGHAQLEVWPQMPHVFQAAAWLPESRRALSRVRAFADAHRPPDGGAHGTPARAHTGIV